jgi:hypothetical protein
MSAFSTSRFAHFLPVDHRIPHRDLPVVQGTNQEESREAGAIISHIYNRTVGNNRFCRKRVFEWVAVFLPFVLRQIGSASSLRHLKKRLEVHATKEIWPAIDGCTHG